MVTSTGCKALSQIKLNPSIAQLGITDGDNCYCWRGSSYIQVQRLFILALGGWAIDGSWRQTCH